jgi:hypothetical protein
VYHCHICTQAYDNTWAISLDLFVTGDSVLRLFVHAQATFFNYIEQIPLLTLCVCARAGPNTFNATHETANTQVCSLIRKARALNLADDGVTLGVLAQEKAITKGVLLFLIECLEQKVVSNDQLDLLQSVRGRVQSVRDKAWNIVGFRVRMQDA